MIIVGIVLIVAGIVLFFVQQSYKTKATSLKLARATTVQELQQTSGAIAQEIGGGNWRDYVKLVGMIRCEQPLISELRREPCVHYQMTITREYEETVTRKDSDGKTVHETKRGSDIISSNQQSIPFYLEDSSGRIEVNPHGADIETIQVLNEFRQGEQSGNRLTFGGFSITLSASSGRRGGRTLGYRYSESILPVDRRSLVVGMVSDGVGTLVIQKPLEARNKFIISMRDDEELTHAAEKAAQLAFFGMAGSFGLGLILVIADLVS